MKTKTYLLIFTIFFSSSIAMAKNTETVNVDKKCLEYIASFFNQYPQVIQIVEHLETKGKNSIYYYEQLHRDCHNASEESLYGGTCGYVRTSVLNSHKDLAREHKAEFQNDFASQLRGSNLPEMILQACDL